MNLLSGRLSAEMVLTRLALTDLLEQEMASLTAMKERRRQEVDAEAARACHSADSSTQSQTSTHRRGESAPPNVITINSQSQGGVAVDATKPREDAAGSSTTTATGQLRPAGNQSSAASQRVSRSSTFGVSASEAVDGGDADDDSSNVCR